MNEETYKSWSRLLAFLLQLVGVLGIVFVTAFWALTGRVELAFLPFFGTVAGVGKGLDVLKEISTTRAEVITREEASSTTTTTQGGSGTADAS
jgi:hypothetical protein